MSKDGIAYQINLMVDGIGTGMVYVKSKDVPGLHLVGKNFNSMKPLIEQAIKRLFLDNKKQHVAVYFVADVAEFPKPKNLPKNVVVYPVKKAA